MKNFHRLNKWNIAKRPAKSGDVKKVGRDVAKVRTVAVNITTTVKIINVVFYEMALVDANRFYHTAR